MSLLNPLISIILPIYKIEPYLCKCLDSVIAQTYPNLEIILVDDGSPDGCPEICDNYASKDSRIRVVHKQNAGVVLARKTGIDIAKGDYITFADPDDWLEPNYVEYLYELLKEGASDISRCRNIVEYKRNRIRPFKSEQENIEHLTSRQAVDGFVESFNSAVWGTMYERSVLESVS